MTRPKPSAPQGLSLRAKILLPFFLILTLLGSGATLVSILLITEALSKTADERLLAFQQVIFREIKKQESLLQSYADLIEGALVVSTPGRGEAGLVPEKLQQALHEANISLTLYPAEPLAAPPANPLQSLLDQARRSGKPRLRFVTDMGPSPALTLAAPAAQRSGKPRHLLLLQAPLDHVFLAQVAAPFNTRAFLFATDGKILAGSEKFHQPPTLTADEVVRVIDGGRVFKTQNAPLPRRHLYAAVPLGTTDVIMLSVELPMSDLRLLVKTMSTGSVAAISLALLTGGYIYYRLIRRFMAPARELMAATQAVQDGNLNYRIQNVTGDEFGRLAESFNSMMGELESLYQVKLAQEKALAVVQEELRFKEILEQKNREIERANRELQAHFGELSALFQVTQAIISTLDQNVLFDRILEVLREVIACDEMVLLLYNPGAEELEVRKAVGLDPEALRGGFRLDEGAAGRAARTQELVYVHDVAADERELPYRGRCWTRGSMVAAPIVVKQRLKGVLNLHKERVAGFTDTEIKLIQAVTNQAAIAIENIQLYEKTKDLSNTDELTRLANRRYFQEILAREVAQARRFNFCFSVIMADIDHFKRFNDVHGHLRGDAVLKKVATVFLQNTRGIDVVARFGGEEFVILLPKTTKAGARAAAEKLRQCVAGEAFVGAERSQPGGRLTLSLGVAEFPGDSRDLYELLDLADQALYLAKERGRNCTVVWNEDTPPLPFVFPSSSADPH